MNAALLLMTSSLMAGADAPAAAAPAPAAAVAGCSGCTDSCDPCGKKPGILDKIKARLGSHKCKSACEPACAPAPAPKCEAPKCDTCDPCHSARPNLLDKLKSKFGKHKDCGCAPACDGCAAAPAPAAPPAGGTTPPKPMDSKKDKVSTDGIPSIVIPSPGALVVPSLPVTPVSGGKLSGSTSPY
ncbi:MAG: hypothetical protein U0791_09230 [Gemmataceae bacterium]